LAAGKQAEKNHIIRINIPIYPMPVKVFTYGGQADMVRRPIDADFLIEGDNFMKLFRLLAITLLLTLCLAYSSSFACTAITLKAQDGAVLFGRTLEWGHFDLKGRFMIVPRGYQFTGKTPDNKPGLTWKAKYGLIGVDMMEEKVLGDGFNEKGLVAGVLYHPGFAEYPPYDPAKASESMAPTDVMTYLLSTCATVEEVRAAMDKIRVVPVVDPAVGMPAPLHMIITEPSGKNVVIEFLKGKTVMCDAPLGVLTNAPAYDWHMTNLRNYIGLSNSDLPAKKIDGIEFKPLGAGSGMLGLPGDFTPPSRFVRAVAFTSTARKTPDGPETMYEMFRILDNFNVPIGEGEGTTSMTDPKAEELMRSSTIWTIATDLKNRVIYYHTQHNRRVRMVDVKAIDFAALQGELIFRPLDKVKAQDIEVVNPLAQ